MDAAPSTTALAWQLAGLAREPKLTVFICPDVRTYRQMVEELGFLLQDAPERLWRFPAWEVLPYDRVSPHHAIVGERFATLARLLREPAPAGVLLTSLPAWLHRIAPPDIVSAHVWQLKRGDALDIAALKERLARAGMRAADRVLASGEFAVRGGILDVWPPTRDAPVRLDMFGDEIESIRVFDPETQRSSEELEALVSAPAREVILDETGRQRFVAAFRARFPHLRRHPMQKAAEAGRPHPGIESLLPLAYEETARLPDYLPEGARLLAPPDIEERRAEFAARVRDQFELVRATQEPVVSPQELYAIETPVRADALSDAPGLREPPSLESLADAPHPLQAFRQQLREHLAAGGRALLVAHGPGQMERMLEALELVEAPRCEGVADMPADALVAAALGWLARGLAIENERLWLLTGREVLGQRLPRRRMRAATVTRADAFASLRELAPGDPVVHEDHGVGRYRGLVAMPSGDGQADFIHIEYAEGASVYVPVDELGRLHRYTGDETPPLHKLGSEKWKRTREKARRDLLAMAHELIDVEAARRRVRRPPCRLEGDIRRDYEEFAARFPFEETDDQVAAIDAVLEDLARETPMDRVICGDVGFGKTEVAMRAAFVVARCGRQVAVLAPTTVLASQHLASFRERFAGAGMVIEAVTRLQTAGEIERIRRELESGRIRIVIGTHRLLSDAFRFADLGLVVVDEEQRFGVRHKEKLKTLQAGADVLTLTATPIPRTLHQTLSGLRGVSIISTPPGEREAIRTMVAPFDPHLANEAIRRELYRGGQVYYLHNHVKSIERIARRLREEVPEADIAIAHGQMPPVELDRAMMRFYEGQVHVLVCTTIVESGLDVPNANTLIVERADLLGLAQLHQIRGRVGRSHRQAYAYLFTPDPRAMTPDARDRLQVIAEHAELGAGFLIARHDMELRGAGNLLGAEQSGQIEAIGLDMYLDMLSRAIRESRGLPDATARPVELRLGGNAILPPDYIPQAGERLALYRRIADMDSDEQAHLLFEEMTDRFGPMPEEARLTLEHARIRWRARKLALAAVRAEPRGIRLHFTADSPIDPARMLARVQREPNRFRLTPDGNLTLLAEESDRRARLAACIAFLDELLAEV